MYQSFLIKYAEIAIKGKNRHLFEDALVSQICHALREVDGEFNVQMCIRDRLWKVVNRLLSQIQKVQEPHHPL